MKKQEIQPPLKRTRIRKPSKLKALKLVKTLKKNALNASATARELGITPQAVHHQLKENPIVKTAIEKYEEALERAGANDDKSARVISEAMDAEKTVSVEDFTGGEDDAAEAEEQFKKNGKTYRSITEPDHTARLKANDQYIKVKKLIAPEKPGSQENHLHLHMGDKKTHEILTELGTQIAALKPKNASN